MWKNTMPMTISIDPKIKETFVKAVAIMKKRKLAKSMSKEIEGMMLEYIKGVQKTSLNQIEEKVKCA